MKNPLGISVSRYCSARKVRYRPVYVKMQVVLLIFTSLNVCFAASLTMEQRMENIEKNNKIAEAKIGALEEKVKRLETEMQKLKETNRQKSLSTSAGMNKQNSMPEYVFHRTCHEARAANSSLVSGMHWIDPDGQGTGDDPIFVHCNFTTGTTSILHDSESEMNVGHCADRGCYSRKINYYATNRQIAALTELSAECHQTIKYDCISAALHLPQGSAFSWWNDRNGNPQYFWSGNNASYHACQCGIDQNCFEPFLTCNCDSALHTNLSDNGIITAKKLLPVTKLNFGRTQLASSSGIHTLGRFECSEKVAVSGMPKSCADLWQIGHTLSGLYSVKGQKQIKFVYCDFTKLPSDSGFQTQIGFVDVKSSPVYFYVQRDSNFNTRNAPIPFGVERLNVGGAMNLTSGIFTAPQPGTYFFSFSGVSSGHGNSNVAVGLYVNDKCIGIGVGHKTHDTVSLQSTLRLNAGDKVSVQISYANNFLFDDSRHYTHFTGWLLEEYLSS